MHTRIFRWTCDICAETQEKESYGLPPGLRYVLPFSTYGNKHPIHACLKCRQEHCITDGECDDLTPSP